MMDKPSCYSCKYRGEVPGSVHSSCKHPDIPEYDPLTKIIALTRRPGPMVDLLMATKFGIKLEPTGVKGGWANWPLDYDPIWVSGCQKHEEK